MIDIFSKRVLPTGIGTVSYADLPGGSVPSRRATILGSPRLLVCRAGRRHHSFLGPNGPVSLTLEPCEALYVAPDCWLDTWYDGDNDALSVVFSRPRARVLYLRYRWARDRGETMRATPDPMLFIATAAQPDIGTYLDELAASSERPEWYAANVVECLLYHLAEALRLPEPQSSGKAEASYHLVRYYVDEHCQEPLSRTAVGAALGMHPSHVSRLFSRFSTASFSDYLNEARTARALRLLHDETKTVAEVAYQCGFSSPGYFTRVFRSRTGTTPLAYKTALSRRDT